MSRNLPIEFVTALQQEITRPVYFFHGEFKDDAQLRISSYNSEITWGGEIWIPAGTLLGISDIEETSDVSSSGTTVSLSGIPFDMVSLMLQSTEQNRFGRIYFGLLDENYSLVCDPIMIFSGRLDVPSHSETEDSAIITVSYENRLVDLKRSSGLRYTDESHKLRFPGDKAFEYVTSIQEKEIVWR